MRSWNQLLIALMRPLMPLRKIPFFGKTENPFHHWPPAPSPRPIISQKEGLRPVTFKREDDTISLYPSTLIVGLGQTGERVLALLEEKFAANLTAQKTLPFHAVLLAEEITTKYKSKQIRKQKLKQPDTISRNRRDDNRDRQSSRKKLSSLFQEPENYEEYQNWGREKLLGLDLQKGVQVFVVGNLAEPIVGIIGDILQILRNLPESLGRNVAIKNCVFLSTSSPAASTRLSSEERFSVMREISRFTFSGPHKMSASFGGANDYVDAPLIDFLFVLENLPTPSKKIQEQEDIDQIVSENLYALMHPSSREIWEDLQADLQNYGKIRKKSQRAVVHSSGVATLYIPINELKYYLSVRLAQAVIFGERRAISEGLLSSSLKTTFSTDKARTYAHRWLLNGIFSHPLFSWILDASSPSSFDILPDVSSEFDIAFMTQLSHALHIFLNDGSTNLLDAKRILEWLDAHLAKCESWLSAGKAARSEQAATLHERYTRWHHITQSFIEQIQAWHETFFALGQSSPQISANETADDSNWRNLLAGKKNAKLDVDKHKSYHLEGSSSSLRELLKKYRKNAEKALSEATGNSIYRSVMASDGRGLKEIDKYYADTIRPELSQLGNESSVSFSRISKPLIPGMFTSVITRSKQSLLNF